MSIAGSDEVSEILDRVKGWSAPSRIALAMGILESLDQSGVGELGPGLPAGGATRGVSDDAVVGFLSTERDPPSDEQCRLIVEEERWKNHGIPTF